MQIKNIGMSSDLLERPSLKKQVLAKMQRNQTYIYINWLNQYGKPYEGS